MTPNRLKELIETTKESSDDDATIIEIRGGNAVEVYSTNLNNRVFVLDWDVFNVGKYGLTEVNVAPVGDNLNKSFDQIQKVIDLINNERD